MSSADPNPYAPPQSDPAIALPAESMAVLDPPIAFSGTLTEQDIRAFLRQEGDLGLFVPLMLVICFGMVGLVLFIQGGAFAAIAVGAIGLLLIAIVVSTLPYRELLFKSANPRCFSPAKGELGVDGIHHFREDVTTFFRWDWFGGAVISERLVGFLPATQPDQPQLVALHMLEQSEDWSRVLSAAVTPPFGATGERLRQRNFSLLRDPARPRTRAVPHDAIAFSGVVGSDDLAVIPSSRRGGGRSVRANIVLTLLVLCGALILAGASSIFFDHVALVLGFALLYALLAGLGIAIRLKRRGSTRSIVYCINGFASHHSIVIDFAVTVTQFRWPALRVAARHESAVILQRRDSSQVIVILRDMFESDAGWERFCVLISEKLDHSS